MIVTASSIPSKGPWSFRTLVLSQASVLTKMSHYLTWRAVHPINMFQPLSCKLHAYPDYLWLKDDKDIVKTSLALQYKSEKICPILEESIICVKTGAIIIFVFGYIFRTSSILRNKIQVTVKRFKDVSRHQSIQLHFFSFLIFSGSRAQMFCPESDKYNRYNIAHFCSLLTFAQWFCIPGNSVKYMKVAVDQFRTQEIWLTVRTSNQRRCWNKSCMRPVSSSLEIHPVPRNGDKGNKRKLLQCTKKWASCKV